MAKKLNGARAAIWGGAAGGAWSMAAAVYDQPEAASFFTSLLNISTETASGFVIFAIITGGLVSARNINAAASDDEDERR